MDRAPAKAHPALKNRIVHRRALLILAGKPPSIGAMLSL
jgi:hypothetical protein